MRVTLLVLHRRESYPGQYSPEVMSVVDEVTLEENPDWGTEEVERQQNSVGGDASAWAQVSVELSTDQLMAALYPQPVVLDTTIVATSTT